MAQSECRSIIGAHINPVSKDSTIGLGLESTLGAGFIDESPIANIMLIGAFDYTSINKEHHIDIEGVGKYWSKFHGTPGAGRTDAATDTTETSESTSTDKKYFGLREGYYLFNHTGTTIKTGVQTTTAGDYFLMDERVLGVKVIQQLNTFEFQAMLATTNRDLARMQNVCGVRPLYNVLKSKTNINQVGVDLFETNFVNANIKWENGKVANTAASSAPDEFEPVDEFSAIEENSNFKFNEAGALYYQEFGSGFSTIKHYVGAFSSINLFSGIEMKLEAVQQFISNNNTFAYTAELYKDVVWQSGASSKFNLGYIGKLNSDSGSVFSPAFTNLFLGEVARLDAFDLPIYFGSVSHTFPIKLNPHIRFRYVGQQNENKTNEFDIELGFKFMKHAKFTGIYSLISSKLVTNNINMFRFELRVAF